MRAESGELIINNQLTHMFSSTLLLWPHCASLPHELDSDCVLIRFILRAERDVNHPCFWLLSFACFVGNSSYIACHNLELSFAR